MKGPVLEHVASAAVCLASKGCSLYDPDEQGVTATHGSSTPEAWLAGCLTSMPHPNVTPSGGAKWIPPSPLLVRSHRSGPLLSYLSYLGAIFMKFRGPKALNDRDENRLGPTLYYESGVER